MLRSIADKLATTLVTTIVWVARCALQLELRVIRKVRDRCSESDYSDFVRYYTVVSVDDALSP